MATDKCRILLKACVHADSWQFEYMPSTTLRKDTNEDSIVV